MFLPISLKVIAIFFFCCFSYLFTLLAIFLYGTFFPSYFKNYLCIRDKHLSAIHAVDICPGLSAIFLLMVLIDMPYV